MEDIDDEPHVVDPNVPGGFCLLVDGAILGQMNGRRTAEWSRATSTAAKLESCGLAGVGSVAGEWSN